MKKKLTELRDDFLKQLESYNKFPANSNFDKGYKSGILHCLGALLYLYKSLRNKRTIEIFEVKQ